MVVKPLGIPAGSVRALLLLSLAARAVFDLREGDGIAGWLATTLIICASAYFAARAAANARRGNRLEGEQRGGHPLGLPAGTVRTLFLAALGYGAYLWFDHYGAEGANVPVAWVLGAFVIGLITRLLFSKLRLPEDHGARGADHLLALITLVAGVALPLLSAMGASPDMANWIEPLLACVVVHYFATRT
ncbi:MAG: hypothetical protein QNJ98_17965 [Planctomycetota bacterium]|nr:hypothetical protein [Planctomycetota bacterium]